MVALNGKDEQDSTTNSQDFFFSDWRMLTITIRKKKKKVYKKKGQKYMSRHFGHVSASR